MMAKTINLIAKHAIKNQFQCFLRDFNCSCLFSTFRISVNDDDYDGNGGDDDSNGARSKMET